MRTILVSFFVFLSVIIGTCFSFNYWQDSNQILANNSIIELSNKSQIQRVNIPEGKTLIPIGAVLKENDINQISYNYIVDNSELSIDNLSVSNVILSKNNQNFNNLNELLNFDISIVDVDYDLNCTYLSLTISLNMPNSQAEYELLVSSQISFMLNVF